MDVQTATGVSFADVAGVDEAKDGLMEVVDFPRHPKECRRLGAHIPNGVLLVGPAGTGRTPLASLSFLALAQCAQCQQRAKSPGRDSRSAKPRRI